MAFRITKVYTKQGDQGETRLGGGQTVSKDSLRIRAYGTVDELNSILGIAIAFNPDEKVKEELIRIQNLLFTVGGQLCILPQDKGKWQMPEIHEGDITRCEHLMDKLNLKLSPLEDFVLSGGTPTSGFLHQARCVCRRAESLVVELSKIEQVDPILLKFLNRLSDTLFVFARYENFVNGVDDITWDKTA